MPDLGLEVLLKGKNFIRLLEGLWTALRISLVSALIGILAGILLGVLAGRKKSVFRGILGGGGLPSSTSCPRWCFCS